MTKTILKALFLFLILNFQCKKNDNKPTIDVSQITSTDALGNILSQDITDWTKDNNWTIEEQGLFQTPTPAQLVNTETATVSLFPAYPNPVSNAQFIGITTSKITLGQIVITDDKLTIKKRFFFNTPSTPQAIAYLFDSSIFSNDTNYRLYYGFYSLSDGLFYKGHGDIRISR